MASVHESLYFNPMMTNGVVHASVFGTKDWVTPYKMALLVLLSELGRAGAQLGLLERRRLNRLLLPLLQVGEAPGPALRGRAGGRAATLRGRLPGGLSRRVALLPRALTCRCRDCARPSRRPARTWPAPCTSGGRRGRAPRPAAPRGRPFSRGPAGGGAAGGAAQGPALAPAVGLAQREAQDLRCWWLMPPVRRF